VAIDLFEPALNVLELYLHHAVMNRTQQCADDGPEVGLIRMLGSDRFRIRIDWDAIERNRA
jgi:hypothetical protein